MIGQRRSTRWGGGIAWVWILALSVFPIGNPGAIWAEEGPPATAEPPQTPQDEIRVVPRSGSASPSRGDTVPDLDDLLHLPSGFDGAGSRRVAGTTETEWRRRFSTATAELAEAKAELDQTKKELDGVAEGGGASQWSVAAPGSGGAEGGQSNSPMSFKLRQQLKRNRERIETAERSMRELKIEADLAGVPPGWRIPKAAPTGDARR